MTNRYIQLCALAGAMFWAACATEAWAGSAIRAVTPSGRPDMIFQKTTLDEAGGKLANQCMNQGMSVVSSTPTAVTCESPMDMMKSAVTQALLGNSYSTAPRRFMLMSLAKIRDDVRVQASGWLEMQSAFGQVQRHPFTDDNSYNFMMDFMAAAGAKFLPGTSFPNQVFIGSAFSRFVQTEYKGRKTLGLLPGDLVASGPLHQAGAMVGDIIVAIDGKHSNVARISKPNCEKRR